MKNVARARVLSASLLALALVMTACGGGGTSSNKGTASGSKLIIVSPGGSYAAAQNAAYWQPFANETGTKIEIVEGGDDPVAAVKAQVQSGNVQWDLVACAPGIVLANPDIWQPVDKSIVKAPADMVYNGIGDKYVLTEVSAFPLYAFSTMTFPDSKPQPASWSDFFDTKKFPGPRGVPNVGLDSAWSVPAAALLADGVPVDQLFPLDLDRAYKKLDQLKSSIRVFWTSFSQSQDILKSGEVVMDMMTDGRAGQLAFQGVPVKSVFNQSFRFSDSFCVPKGAPHAATAWRLLEYLLTHPKQQAVFASLTFYGPPTKAGITEAEKLGVKDFSSLHVSEMIPDTTANLDYIAKNSDMLLSRWNTWVGA